MKLIIEIPEHIKEELDKLDEGCRHAVGWNIATAIMNGIPLPEEHDDLISRSDLKKDLASYDREFAPDWVLNRIDNAPTVDAIVNTIEVRPQGEWIVREDMDYLDENKVVHKHFQCNHCGFIHDFIDGHTSQYNFCPQCGYRLEGGIE